MKGRRGFTFVEVLVALLIIVFGLGPLILHYTQETRVAYFNEFHLLARYRARRQLEHLAALDYETIRLLAADPQGLVGVVPAVRYELPVLTGEATLPAYLAFYTDKMELFRDELTWTELDPAGLARVDVEVRWREPGDRPGRSAHGYRHTVLVSRSEVGCFGRPPVARGGTS